MSFYDSPLYAVADNLSLPTLRSLAKQVAVVSVLRITAYYPERAARHTVATLIERTPDSRMMEIVYEGFFEHKPLKHSISRDALEKVMLTLRQVKFDKLLDQPNVTYHDKSLWLISRAAGTFTHSIIVSPDVPQLPYSQIVNAIDAYFPTAIRELPLD